MIELGKEYQTRSELEVRIYAVDCGGDRPVHGAVFEDDRWAARVWTELGHCYHHLGESPYDLIEKPQTIKWWANVYGNGGLCGGYNNRSRADKISDNYRIGVLRIEITGDKYEVFKEDV